MEWDHIPAPEYLQMVLTNEVSLPQSIDPDPRVKITDDHPLNEYYLLRRTGLK